MWESADGWNEFLEAVSAEHPTTCSLTYEVAESGDVHLCSQSGDITLTFDASEWAAFRAGVNNGEFSNK